MFQRKKSLRERLTGKVKIIDKEISEKYVIKFLSNLSFSEIKKGFDYVDNSPISNHSYFFNGEDVSKTEMIEYIKSNFPNSVGKHKAFYNKKKDLNEHTIKLYKKIENIKECEESGLEIRFLD